MPTYIGLANWTDRGIGSFQDTLQRLESATAVAQQMGGQLREVFYTVGPYDMVVVSEFPDDETASAFSLALGSRGNVRTTSLRAFSSEEMTGIIEKTGMADPSAIGGGDESEKGI